MPELNIGVLGAARVGKSTFIQRAFDLPSRSSSRSNSRKMSIDGSIYAVRLHELPFKEVEVEDDKSINWPERIGDAVLPAIDGALVLYDVMGQESLADVPRFLSEWRRDN